MDTKLALAVENSIWAAVEHVMVTGKLMMAVPTVGFLKIPPIVPDAGGVNVTEQVLALAPEEAKDNASKMKRDRARIMVLHRLVSLSK